MVSKRDESALGQIVGLAVTLGLLWMTLVPEHQRTLWRLRALRESSQALRGVARVAGRLALTLEKRTSRPDRAGYELPLMLGVSADRIDDLIRKTTMR